MTAAESCSCIIWPTIKRERKKAADGAEGIEDRKGFLQITRSLLLPIPRTTNSVQPSSGNDNKGPSIDDSYTDEMGRGMKRCQFCGSTVEIGCIKCGQMGVQITEDVIYGWSHNGAVFPPDEKTARQFAFGSNPRGGGGAEDVAVKNCLPLCLRGCNCD